MDWAGTADSTNSQNPYAQLSSLEPDDPQAEPLQTEPWWEKLIWKSKTEVYEFVRSSFGISQIGKRPPLLKQFAATVVDLSAPAQNALHRHILTYIPELPIVHNRLAPKERDHLLTKLLGMADDAKALDAEKK